jgi:uncharacterized membrane protein YdjX (TVP38/TMEM64 family)
MKSLIKIILIIALFFASTFLVAKLTGFLNVDQIKGWLTAMKASSSIWVGVIVMLLLFADLFIAVPTMSLCILSGYFLGYQMGVAFAMAGMISAGFSGYALSYRFGDTILGLIIKKEKEKGDIVNNFKRYGFTMILLSRAVPILPEVTACLSGMTRMPFYRFALAWLISTTPYVLIAVYSGSVSTLDNPKPAIFTAIGISSVLWISWYLFSSRIRKPSSQS